MTIENLNTEDKFLGNGSTTSFATQITILSESQLEVYLREDGVDTLQFIDTHYTLTGVGILDTVTVLMGTAPASGQSLVVVRNTSPIQQIDIAAAFKRNVIEEAFDKLTMMVQELFTKFQRTLRFPSGETTQGILPTVEQRADNVLAFDSLGAPLAGPS